MQALNCLIVEDEHLAAGIIKDYIDMVPGLRLQGIYGDVFSVNELLRSEKTDLIFLDIHLPGMSGIDFLKTLNGRYPVILTTAYHEFALEGFNLNVVDYLLKPIEFSRFLQAVNKVYAKRGIENKVPQTQKDTNRSYFFNTDKRKIKVNAADILYIESLKDYVRIHTASKPVITKFQIGEIDEFLADERFIRIHKSYLVNIEKITAYSATEIELGDVTLPLGRTYKETVATRLQDIA